MSGSTPEIGVFTPPASYLLTVRLLYIGTRQEVRNTIDWPDLLYSLVLIVDWRSLTTESVEKVRSTHRDSL
jgi:hypothetical protein